MFNRVSTLLLAVKPVKRFNGNIVTFIYNFACVLICLICLTFILSGCGSSPVTQPGTWKTYHNSRYGFEFLYPSNWIASPPPDNADGQAFAAPQDAKIEIRGWASNQLPTLSNSAKLVKSNFKTQQGILGQLKVHVSSDISSIKLTLIRGKVHYNWQGQAPSQEFDNYYRLFYYIVERYQVP